MRYLATQLFGGLLALLLVPGLAMAQETGKLSGQVVEAETGDPLPGANVVLEGTSYGAATNSDGEYTILRIPPGTYTVRVSFVGYRQVRRTNVQITSGITRRLDFELQEAQFEGEGVVVRAEEPLVNPTATNAVRRMGREEIENLPTRDAETYYAIQPGVTEQNGEIHIRGGRSDETDYLLDGLSSRSLLGTDNVVSVIPEALEETQVFAGGYQATRGGANGGIVQQTLRTGGEELSATAQYEGDQVASGFNNTYSYGDQDAVFTVDGPLIWDQHRFFVAANYIETDNHSPIFWEGANLNYQEGGGLCGNVAQSGCHPPVDDVRGDTAVAPLQWEDGKIPGGRPNEELKINSTLLFDFSPLRVRVSFAQTTRERRNNDLPIESFYNQKRVQKREDLRRLVSVQPTYFLTDNTYVEGTAGFFQYQFENYDPLLGKPTERGNGGFVPDVVEYQDRHAVAEALGVGTDSTSLAGHNYTRFWPGRYQEPPLYRFNSFRFNRPGAVETGYFTRDQSYWHGSLNFVSQQENHELQAGGEYKQWTARQYFHHPTYLAGNLRNNPSAYRDAIEQEEEAVAFDIRRQGPDYYGYDEFGHEVNSGPDGPKEPVEAAAWVNDKIEYEDIIVNAGLRLSYFDMDSWTVDDPQNPPYDADNAQVNVGGENGLREAAADTEILPRLGLSFPVSDQTVFHLQYGKFAQMPDLANVYAGRADMAQVYRGGFFISSPFAYDLDPIKTTQYEIGFGHQFSDFAAFDLTAYYRRTDGQLQIQNVGTSGASDASDYNLFRNGDFSITRGFEVSVRSRRIGGVMTMVNYSLNDAKGTNSEPSGQVSALESGLQTPTQIQPLEFMQRHQGSVVFDYRTGTDQSFWARDWSANLLVQFSSGHRFTRSTGGIGQRGADDGPLLPDADPRNRIPLEPINSSTTPFTSQLDLRLQRGFDVGPASATAYIYIQNLLNRRNVRNVYLRSGNASSDGFFDNPELSESIVEGQGPRYVDYYRAINLDNRHHYRDDWNRDIFGEPRQVRIGFTIEY